MNNGKNEMAHRVLVIDDNPDIYKDFQTILLEEEDSAELNTLRAEVFGDNAGEPAPRSKYELDFASQGKEGNTKVKQALSEDRPYELVFVDMRMPPDWDGLTTIEHIWKTDPNIQVVICTAYSDHSWEEITERLGRSESLLILKKPFDSAEVAQLASALTQKWILARQASMKTGQLEQMVEERTQELTKTNERLEQEIAERKRTEQNLKATKEHAELIYRVVPSAIFTVDKEKHITSWNNKAVKITGYTAEEMLGKECTSFSLTPCGDKCGLYSDDVEKPVIAKECTIKRKDGKIGTISKNVDFLKDTSGNIIGGIESFEDITERKRTEQQQAKLLKEVENINQELKDFAYIVSHDLKAPLRGIKALANWLSTDYADKFDEEGREQMNLLLSRVQRMHNLIDGVLQYSRVGRVKEEWVAVNLNTLVPEVIDMVAPPQNVAITVENELPTIKCEETRIMQVFQNLLSNAVKHMDKPQGQIKVSCVEEDGFWKFSVADNGPGIEQKHFEEIFKMFKTLSVRDEFENTGVGLTVAKKIVELYNGKIWVESKIGKGSTFFFTLPKQMGAKNANIEANIAG